MWADLARLLYPDGAGLRKAFDAWLPALETRIATEVANVSTVIDFRDYVEDVWVRLTDVFGLSGEPLNVSLDTLIKALKTQGDCTKRRGLVKLYVLENVKALQPKIACQAPVDLIQAAVDLDVKQYVATASAICKYRPVLRASLQSMEAAVKTLERLAPGGPTLQDIQEIASLLGSAHLLPALAFWKAWQNGEVDDLFINKPLDRVFGSPAAVRNSVERPKTLKGLVRGPKQALSLKRAVLAGHGFLAWRHDDNSWLVEPASAAYLLAALPGLSKHVWCLRPDTMQAAVYIVGPKLRCVAEFELPAADDLPNWIDCQRDEEGLLVFQWGQLNERTGHVKQVHMVALDEDQLTSDMAFSETVSKLPERKTAGVRIDWRDHGNLLTVQQSVKDLQDAPERRWTFRFDVVFGPYCLMTVETDTRPLDGVFGSPEDLVLLSPLSSTMALQRYTLTADNTFAMAESSEVPKAGSRYWSQVAITYEA